LAMPEISKDAKLHAHPGAQIWPVAPRPEWFFAQATNLTKVDQPPGMPNDTPPEGSFQKLTKEAYIDYISCHNLWLTQIHLQESSEHDFALLKRLRSKEREVVTWSDEAGDEYSTPRRVLRTHPAQDGNPKLSLQVVAEAKMPFEPKLSTGPHQDEKRANRKMVRDARVKVKANAAEAQAEILALKTVPVIKEQRLAIEKLAELRPLHKAEENAAKSAALRASLIKKSSPDLVPQVVPDEGWKLVTRKKGDISKILASTTKMGAAGTQLHHAEVTGDPALIRGAGKLLAATTRMPSSTSGRS